jgi:hypothetical protein
MDAKLKAKLFGLVALFALASVSQQASAAVLYDNGPINGTISGYAITDGYAVSNSFTLSQDSIVTGVNFGAWVLQSASLTASLTAVDWAITTIPSSYPINGSASVTTEPTGIPTFRTRSSQPVSPRAASRSRRAATIWCSKTRSRLLAVPAPLFFGI